MKRIFSKMLIVSLLCGAQCSPISAFSWSSMFRNPKVKAATIAGGCIAAGLAVSYLTSKLIDYYTSKPIINSNGKAAAKVHSTKTQSGAASSSAIKSINVGSDEYSPLYQIIKDGLLPEFTHNIDGKESYFLIELAKEQGQTILSCHIKKEDSWILDDSGTYQDVFFESSKFLELLNKKIGPQVPSSQYKIVMKNYNNIIGKYNPEDMQVGEQIIIDLLTGEQKRFSFNAEKKKQAALANMKYWDRFFS